MAATTIDELQVLITAQTQSFNKAMSQVNDQLNEVSNTSGKLSKASVAAFGAIAGAAQTLVNKGINLISESVSNAAKRVDTLNNSQKVFQNLGFSAQDTKTQMDFLDHSIRGLPTTLNDAVTGVEALASVSGNLKDSTKTYKAINDGILAMGGSANEVQGAIMQLSQLPLDGPLDAQTWNSLRQNGLTPVITAMSKDMGISIAQMKDDFSTGKLTVQDFTNELQKLDTQGGGGMASLEKQAKDATHGIQTGWANMQTAITRGVADIIKSVGASNISGVLAGIGKDFEKGLSGVADGVSRVKGYLDALSKMDPQQAAQSIGTELGKALRLAFQNIKLSLSDMKKLFDSIDWFSVGKEIVTKIIPGIFAGLIAGLGSDALWTNLWSIVTQHWGEIILGVLMIALAPAKVLGPLTKLLEKIPLLGPLTNWVIRGIRGLAEPIRVTFGGIFGKVFTDIGIRFLVFMDSVKALFGTFADILLAPFRLFVQEVAGEISLLPGFFSDMLAVLKNLIGLALDVIKTGFVNAFRFIFDSIRTIFAPFTEFFSSMFSAIGRQLDGMPSMFTNAFRGAWDGVRGIWSTAGDWFAGIWGRIRGVFGDVGGWFSAKFSSAYNAVTGVFSRLTGFFSDLWGRITGIFRNAGTSVGDAIGGAFKSVMNTILDRVAGMVNGVFHAINGAIGVINKIPHVNIGKIGNISVPHLATGGIIPPGFNNDTFPAMLSSGEAVIPLDKLDRMMGGSKTPVNVQIDGKTLISFVIDGINNKAFMTNSSVIDF